jgi:hypothetical protein
MNFSKYETDLDDQLMNKDLTFWSLRMKRRTKTHKDTDNFLVTVF